MNKVLIQDGLVHEIFGEVAPELHESLLVVEAPDDVKHGWVYDGSSFTAPEPPPEPTYGELRAGAYPSIQDQLDALFHAGLFPAEMAAQIQAVKDKYPRPEKPEIVEEDD